MAFLETLQSKYQKYHKKNNIIEQRQVRVENQHITRRVLRTQNMDTGRNLRDAITPNISRVRSPTPRKQASPHVDRLTKLKLWKQERAKKMEQQKMKQKPIFKIGAPKDLGFPQLLPELTSFAPKNHVFKPPKNIKAIKETKNPVQRVTRSQKPIVSPHLDLPLPTRRRRGQKTNDQQIAIKPQIQLVRQNAMDETLQNEKPGTSTKRKSNGKRRKSLRTNLFMSSNSGTESQTSQDELEDNVFTTKSPEKIKRKSSRKSLKDKTKSPQENLRRKTRKSRNSLQKNTRDKENQTENQINSDENKTKTPVKRKSIKISGKNKNVKSWGDITPENTNVYVSPFVTTSRGKGSVRKENLERSIRGLTSFSESTSTSTGASYFYTVLNNEISRLQDLCDTWTNYKDSEDVVLSEDANDMIDVAVGQATLLMNKKFCQFEGLIRACQNGFGMEKEVTCEDLQGFWDMIYMQVENLNTRFDRLSTMRNNNWEEIKPVVQVKVTKKRTISKSTSSVASSGIRAAILEARKKKQASSKSASTPTEQKEDESVFNGGFFVVRTPHKNTPGKHTPKNRVSDPTPKSILKSTKKKSVPNLNKSVLFKDEEESDSESVLNSTFDKTPAKKEKPSRRRSTRK